MSGLEKLKLNDPLLVACDKAIASHNKISYRAIKINAPFIEFKMISPPRTKVTDSLALEIIQFYEKYSIQASVATQLREAIDSSLYTNDDLKMNIDRSEEGIIQILSTLTEYRMKLETYYEQIISNLSLAIKTLVEHVQSTINKKSNFDQLISTIYICMKQQGLKINLNRAFVAIGTDLLVIIHKSNFLTKKQIRHIYDLNQDLKYTILEGDSIMQAKESMNLVQSFGIVPDEGPLHDLSSAVETLLGLKMEEAQSFESSKIVLKKLLQLATSDTGLHTGLICILSSREDKYFDTTSLKDLDSKNGIIGITEASINATNLLKEGPRPSIRKSELITINVEPGVIQLAYILWTNDLKLFKIKSRPIYRDLIEKITRKSPSVIIEAYNLACESTIAKARDYDAVSFNRVRYMSFTNAITEEVFLDGLQTKLVDCVMKHLGKLKRPQVLDKVVESEFTKTILDLIDHAKSTLGIHPSLLSAHCHIIYAAMANKIATKLKKALIHQPEFTKVELAEMVAPIVKTNDNIYSRTIASYYLHIA